jgi:hypothetical protein
MNENTNTTTGRTVPKWMEGREAEIATYYRELPRLLAEGHAGKEVLIKGDQIIGLFDDRDEAFDIAAERFGFGPYLVQDIDAKYLKYLAPYFDANGEPSGPVPDGGLTVTEPTPASSRAVPKWMEGREAEIATFYRELPRLLAEGHRGKEVLIKGDQIIGIYDTLDEGHDVAAERFGFGPYLLQDINPIFLEHLAPYFPPRNPPTEG